MALTADLLIVFGFFRSLWGIFPVVVQSLIYFTLYVFIVLAILRMTHGGS